MPDEQVLLRDELSTRFRTLFGALDDVLISNHATRAHLKPGYPPFLATTELGLMKMPSWVGLRHFGAGPLFDLWTACRDIEWMRVLWTGTTSPDAPAAIPMPNPPVPAARAAPAEPDNERALEPGSAVPL